MCHGLNPQVNVVFTDARIVSTGQDLSLYIFGCGTAVGHPLFFSKSPHFNIENFVG